MREKPNGQILEEMIRVSYIFSVRSMIGERYLLIKHQDHKDYSPLGGGVQYTNPEIKSKLNYIGACFENSLEPDLRFSLPLTRYAEAVKIINASNNRETSSRREVIEELAEESRILTDLRDEDFGYELFLRSKILAGTSIRDQYRTTLWHINIHEIGFKQEIKSRLLQIAITFEDRRLILASEEEIRNQRTDQGLNISQIAYSILPSPLDCPIAIH